jgi:glucose-6-phosphate isomerase
MMQIMLLGGLLNINPFDQPNVEAYKQETRLILEKKGL